MNFLLEEKYLEILSKEEFDLVLSQIDFSHVDLNLFLKNAMQNILTNTLRFKNRDILSSLHEEFFNNNILVFNLNV